MIDGLAEITFFRYFLPGYEVTKNSHSAVTALLKFEAIAWLKRALSHRKFVTPHGVYQRLGKIFLRFQWELVAVRYR
jgi:hypothetical protein